LRTAPPTTPTAAPAIAVATGSTTDFTPEPLRELPLELDARVLVPLELSGFELEPPLSERERDCALPREEAPRGELRLPLDALPDRWRERPLLLATARVVGLLPDVRRFVLARPFALELCFLSLVPALSRADRWLELAIIPPCPVAAITATPVAPRYTKLTTPNQEIRGGGVQLGVE
jgi:hypothetical protein